MTSRREALAALGLGAEPIDDASVQSIERYTRSPKVRETISILRRQVQQLTKDLDVARFEATEADKRHRAESGALEVEVAQLKATLDRERKSTGAITVRTITIERDELRRKLIAHKIAEKRAARAARRARDGGGAPPGSPFR